MPQTTLNALITLAALLPVAVDMFLVYPMFRSSIGVGARAGGWS